MEDRLLHCKQVRHTLLHRTVKATHHNTAHRTGKTTQHNTAHTTGLIALAPPTTAINTISFQGHTTVYQQSEHQCSMQQIHTNQDTHTYTGYVNVMVEQSLHRPGQP